MNNDLNVIVADYLSISISVRFDRPRNCQNGSGRHHKSKNIDILRLFPRD